MLWTVEQKATEYEYRMYVLVYADTRGQARFRGATELGNDNPLDLSVRKGDVYKE